MLIAPAEQKVADRDEDGITRMDVTDGQLYRATNAAPIYIIIAGARWHVPDPETFRYLHFQPDEVRIVSSDELAEIPLGLQLPSFKAQEELSIRSFGSKPQKSSLPRLPGNEISRKTTFAYATLVLLSITVALCAVFVIPRMLPYPRSLNVGEVQTARSAAQTALVQALAAVAAIAGLLWTARTFRLSRESLGAATLNQTSERFEQAASMASFHENNPDVRMAGLHALAKIARYSDADRAAIVEFVACLLCFDSTEEERRQRQENHLILRILSEARTLGYHEPYDLDAVAISEITADHLVLSQCRLSNSMFSGVTALYSVFSESICLRPSWNKVDLRNSKLKRVRARLGEMSDCDYSWTDLTGSIFISIDMRNVSLVKAVLTGSHFIGVDLRGANFRSTDASMLNLGELESCDLRGAYEDADTEWPEGFDAKRRGVVRE